MSERRQSCDKCGFLQSQCVCPWLVQLNTDLKILVVQDPKEAKHAKNTVALLRLALPNVKCISVTQIASLSDLMASRWRLVFPSQSAHWIETLGAEEKSNIEGVILLDATWRKAKKWLFTEKVLQHFTCISFAQPPQSNYAIRKAPSEQALSTLEACSYCIEQLRGDDMQPLRNFMQEAQTWQWRQQPAEHKGN
ncbi:tRNA-uridine aminocarboxypropyltransferase [Marinomonas sp. THO17]|uniref:tRNA-uridine aminocarboxypropyltransferase n=1 Tax=Marinomonas sp. THO17 TaxID=3149048 RepID=UPI00336BED9B